jgi:DNA-binding GntR family transcriptional regulator
MRTLSLPRRSCKIIDALKRADGRRAERLMRRNIRRVRDAIFRLVD